MEVHMHAFRWAQPLAAATRRQGKLYGPVDQVEFAPAQVLQSAATTRIPAPVLLKALGHVAVQAGCNALPSPTIRGVLVAMQALQREGDTEALRTFQVQLSRWGMNGQFAASPETLGEILRGADFRVVGKQVSLGTPRPLPANLPQLLEEVPRAIAAGTAKEKGYTLVALHRGLLDSNPELATEDYLRTQLVPLLDVWGAQEAAQLIHAHYGPEVALSTLLDQKQLASDDCWKPITDDVRQTGFRPSPEVTRRLAEYVAREAVTFDRHNSGYEASLALLGAIADKQPDLLDATSRERVQDALVNREKDPFWASYSAFCHRGALEVAAGTPELVERLYDKMDNPVAQAMLIGSALPDDRWEELRGHISALPREDKYRHHFSYFAKADLQRKLDRLSPREAVEQALSLRGPVEEGEARHMVFQKLCAGRTGEQPHLARVAGWYHDALPFWPVFEKAAVEGRLEQARSDAERGLAAMSEGLIGGHQTLVARLMAIQDDRTIDDMMERYRAVQGRLQLNHGSISTTVWTVAALELFGLGSRGQLERGIDWLEHSVQKQGRDAAYEQLEKLAEKVRERQPAERVHAVLERIPTASMEAVGRYLELPEGATSRALGFAEKVTSLGPGLEIAELAQPFDEKLGAPVVDELVDRLRAAGPPDEVPALVKKGLSLLAQGQDLESVTYAILRPRLLDAEPAAPASAIGEQNGNVYVGGVVIRGRKKR